MSMKGPLSVIDWQPAQHALCLSPSESWDGLLMLYCRSRQVDGWTLSLMPTIFFNFWEPWNNDIYCLLTLLVLLPGLKATVSPPLRASANYFCVEK